MARVKPLPRLPNPLPRLDVLERVGIPMFMGRLLDGDKRLAQVGSHGSGG